MSNVAAIAFRSLVRDRANLAFGASIVHGDVETAKPCDGLVDERAHVIVLANVGVDELGLRTERAQLLDERLAGVITPTGNNDLRALVREGDCGGAAYACEGSRDQNDWRVHCATPEGRVRSITSLVTVACLSTTLLPWGHRRLR